LCGDGSGPTTLKGGSGGKGYFGRIVGKKRRRMTRPGKKSPRSPEKPFTEREKAWELILKGKCGKLAQGNDQNVQEQRNRTQNINFRHDITGCEGGEGLQKGGGKRLEKGENYLKAHGQGLGKGGHAEFSRPSIAANMSRQKQRHHIEKQG